MSPTRRHAGAPTLQRRSVRLAPAEIRTDAKAGTFEAVVLRYGVLDDYRTKFDPAVFIESLASRMPRVVWAHDWTDPIGRYTDIIRNDNDALELRGEFDDPESVPSAKRALAQMKSGTIDQFSVGFYVEEEEYDKEGDFYWIRKGDLVEASPVLSAAVPGTSLTGVRMRSRRSTLLVPMDTVELVLVQAVAGNVGVAEALALATEDAVEAPDDEETPDPAITAADDAEDDTEEPETPDETPEPVPAPSPAPEPATVQPATGPEENRPDPDPEPDADVVAAPDLELDELMAELDAVTVGVD